MNILRYTAVLIVWFSVCDTYAKAELFETFDEQQRPGRFISRVFGNSLKEVEKMIPESVKKAVGKVKIVLTDPPDDADTAPFEAENPDRYKSDFLVFESDKGKVLLRSRKVLTLQMENFRSLGLEDASQRLSAFLLYETGRLYFKTLKGATKKTVMKTFSFYPLEMFHSPNSYWRFQKDNMKRYFAWQFMLWLQDELTHQRAFPFSAIVFDKILPKTREKSPRFPGLSLPLKESQPGIGSGNLKNLLFWEDTSASKREFSRVIPQPEPVIIAADRIWGVSVLLAGDEGAGSMGVGHSGLVIWVCPPDKEPGLETCLKNTEEHIAFNPVGDTSFYEHSPVRKVIAGGFSGDFPIVYTLQRLKEYVTGLNQGEKRDAVISPPVVSRENPHALQEVLARIQEISVYNLSKSYLFFSESCVHSCYRILKTPEHTKTIRAKHSFYNAHSILPFTPVALWRYFQDQFIRNRSGSPSDKELGLLWKQFDSVLKRWFHVMFKADQSQKKEIEHLKELNLLWLAEDDGLSKWEREKIAHQARRLSEFVNGEDYLAKLSHDVKTVREYARIHPGKKADYLLELIIDSVEEADAVNKTLTQMFETEKQVFQRLDDFFEKTSVFNEALSDMIKGSNVLKYHLTRGLDLSFHRKVAGELTPFNIFAYLVYQEKGIHHLACFRQKYCAVTGRSYDITSRDKEESNGFVPDKDTLLMIENFYRISEQIHSAIKDGANSPESSFTREFYDFWHSWRYEWELSSRFLNTINQIYNIINPEDVIPEDPGQEIKKAVEGFRKFHRELLKANPHYKKYKPGQSHKSLKSNITASEWYSRKNRLQGWLEADQDLE